jgi:putative zinc finger/helix-turn-helix YgiT family protein
MNCMQCGTKLKTKRESYLYDRDGIKATLLGVPVHRCPECGDFEVEIPRIEELNRTLAGAIIRKPRRLSAAEIRFLRKSLGWSGTDFARQIGVDPATVSRWETGAQDMGQVADRFLRLLVSVRTPIENYSLDDLADLRDAPPPRDAPPLKLKQSATGWHAVAA